MADQNKVNDLYEMANILRLHSLDMCIAADSGHPTSCASIAEIMSVLFFHDSGMHFNPKDPKFFQNDQFILSKGHAAPILYAAWGELGFVDKQLFPTLRKYGSILQGHPTTLQEFVPCATGSLGQGFGNICGMAYASKYIDKINNKFYCIMGDGEIAEGSVWEACEFASYYKLNNIITIIDVNKYGQSGATMYQHNIDNLQKKFSAFGMTTYVIDGHSVEEVIKTFQLARGKQDGPVTIIAQTIKGKGLGQQMEDSPDWHGKPHPKQAEIAVELRSSIKNFNLQLAPTMPTTIEYQQPKSTNFTLPKPEYSLGSEKAVRVGYGQGLAKLGKLCPEVVVLDAETKKSTMTGYFEKDFPDRFVECHIAEQNMVAMANGFASRGKITFSNTFAAFLTRAYDQIRMSAIGFANLKIVGSHCGVSIGSDGASQMGLEDIAMMRAIPGSTVLYPSDAVSGEQAVELAANNNGMFYIRTTRNTTPVIYQNSEKFEIGKLKQVKTSDSDKICVIAAGVTLMETMKASKILEAEGIKIRVIDIFSVKPIDQAGLMTNVQQCGGYAYVVEDHYEWGGITDCVKCALMDENAEKKLQVDLKVFGRGIKTIPKSGDMEDLFKFHRIDAQSIAEDIKKILNIN